MSSGRVGRVWGAVMGIVGRVAVVAALFASAGVLAYEATAPAVDLVVPGGERAPPATGDRAALRRALEAQQAELEALRAKLAALDDSGTYEKAVGSGVAAAVKQANLTPLQQRRLSVAIVREAERNGIDPLLVVAVIRTESSFDNFAVSKVGAMGLMQVMPDTGRYLMETRGGKLTRPTNLFDFELNVELGTAYLAELIQRFGSVERALVAYNAGPGAAKKILADKAWGRRFLDGYPRKVVREWRRLKAAAASAAKPGADEQPI